jgi:hypothetical protein
MLCGSEGEEEGCGIEDIGGGGRRRGEGVRKKSVGI